MKEPENLVTSKELAELEEELEWQREDVCMADMRYLVGLTKSVLEEATPVGLAILLSELDYWQDKFDEIEYVQSQVVNKLN